MWDLSKITSILAWVVVNSFFSLHNKPSGMRKLTILGLSPAISALNSDSVGGVNNQSPFDSDFADMFSKPVPTWFDKKTQDEDNSKNIKKTREEMLKDLRAKFEAVEIERKQKLEEKWAQIQKRMEAKKREKNGWLSQVASLFESDEDKQEEAMKNIPQTLEEMERYLETEEAQQDFSLPGFFEVFPELRWPKWARRKDGSTIECDSDSDCPVPLACCNHPVIPGPKFCCSGWGQRMMVKAYAYQLIKPNNESNSNGRESGNYGYGSCL